MIKIETNSVFFGEKGLTSTSAQHIKDMAGHMNENLKEQLNGVKFVTDEVKLLAKPLKVLPDTVTPLRSLIFVMSNRFFPVLATFTLDTPVIGRMLSGAGSPEPLCVGLMERDNS